MHFEVKSGFGARSTRAKVIICKALEKAALKLSNAGTYVLFGRLAHFLTRNLGIK